MIDKPTTEATAPSFLGVESSLKGRRWVRPQPSKRDAEFLAQRQSLNPLIAEILVSRGLTNDTAADFLGPSLRRLMPDPHRLTQMERATERIALALTKGERIAVLGDYDVDGATSTAQLVRYFRALGVEILTYIPNRLTEGYGPNGAAFKSLKRQGAGLCILVDCGTTAFEALDSARGDKLDCVIIDHHQAEPRIPDCDALVNPNRLDDDSGLGHLAACGVVFLTLVALNRRLREAGYFAAKRLREPDLLLLLDLVALGTVCDVVPLTGLNRAFVAQGLKVMGKGGNAGIQALLHKGGVAEAPTSYHAGFVLGPRINAGGRLGQSALGTALLATTDPNEATALAVQLDSLNAERKAIEENILAEAEAQGAAQAAHGQRLLIASGDGWHAGVTGIIAARLKEKFDRPAFAVAFERDGTGKGSGRSVSGVDLGALVINARQSGHLIAGGGHAMAAGITVAAEKMDVLLAHMEAQIDNLPASAGPTSIIDALVSCGGASADLVEALDQLAPFGPGNPQPRVALANVTVERPALVGTDHVRLTLSDGTGTRLGGICFRAATTSLGQELLAGGGKRFHILGKLGIDKWKSDRDGKPVVQITVEDAALVSSKP